MGENNNKRETGVKAAPVPDDQRLGRRLFFFRAATILSGAAASARRRW